MTTMGWVFIGLSLLSVLISIFHLMENHNLKKKVFDLNIDLETVNDINRILVAEKEEARINFEKIIDSNFRQIEAVEKKNNELEGIIRNHDLVKSVFDRTDNRTPRPKVDYEDVMAWEIENRVIHPDRMSYDNLVEFYRSFMFQHKDYFDESKENA